MEQFESKKPKGFKEKLTELRDCLVPILMNNCQVSVEKVEE
jgi:hypothetical protein